MNTSIKEATIYVPDVWSAQWFRRWVIEQLSKADVRNAIGVGVEITTEGNSVATLTTDAETAGSIDAHNDDPNANPQAFAKHNADSNANAAAFAKHNADPTAHAATIAAAIAAHDADPDAHPSIMLPVAPGFAPPTTPEEVAEHDAARDSMTMFLAG